MECTPELRGGNHSTKGDIGSAEIEERELCTLEEPERCGKVDQWQPS